MHMFLFINLSISFILSSYVQIESKIAQILSHSLPKGNFCLTEVYP